jgi:hypothetical protein
MASFKSVAFFFFSADEAEKLLAIIHEMVTSPELWEPVGASVWTRRRNSSFTPGNAVHPLGVGRRAVAFNRLVVARAVVGREEPDDSSVFSLDGGGLSILETLTPSVVLVDDESLFPASVVFDVDEVVCIGSDDNGRADCEQQNECFMHCGRL